MSRTRHACVVAQVAAVLVVLVCSSRGQHLLAVDPPRAVLLAGQDLELTCSSLSASPTLTWTLTDVEDGTVTTIAHRRNVLVEQDSPTGRRYTVRSTETESHMESVLTVHSIGLQDGGIYQCEDQRQPGLSPKSSSVVVLGGSPVCTVSREYIVEGDMVGLSCEIQCSGQWRPAMEWSGPEGLIPDSQVKDESTVGLVKVTMSQQVTQDLDGAQYSCKTFFDGIHSLPFTFIHHFEPLEVQYSPRNLTVHPMKDVYRPGDLVTCSALGKPSPQFEWRDDENIDKCQGATLLLTRQMEGHRSFSCVATTVIRGAVVHARRTLKLFIHYPADGGESLPSTPAPGSTDPLCVLNLPSQATTESDPTTVPQHGVLEEEAKIPTEKPSYEIYTTMDGKTSIIPHSLEASRVTLNHAVLLPVAILAVVLLVVTIAAAIYCTRRRKNRSKMAYINNSLNLNNDVYLRTCADARTGTAATPNQYATGFGVNYAEQGAHGTSYCEKKGEESDDASSGFYSELVVPEDQPLKSTPEPPALRPDANHNVGELTGEDGYLMPQMQYP